MSVQCNCTSLSLLGSCSKNHLLCSIFFSVSLDQEEEEIQEDIRSLMSRPFSFKVVPLTRLFFLLCVKRINCTILISLVAKETKGFTSSSIL